MVFSSCSTMNDEELSELKEWLTNEVKLQRYFEKLTKYGFTSLELIKEISEEDLDKVGIIPAYHRSRLLRFCKNLNEDVNDNRPHVNNETQVQTGSATDAICNVIIDQCIQDDNPDSIEPNDFDPPPLPPKKSEQTKRPAPKVPDRESSLPRPVQDLLTSRVDDSISETATTMSEQLKRPPPVPPRSDLDSVAPYDLQTNGENSNNSVLIENSVTDQKNNDETSNETTPYYNSTPIKPTPRPRRQPSAKKQLQENEHLPVSYEVSSPVIDSCQTTDNEPPKFDSEAPILPQKSSICSDVGTSPQPHASNEWPTLPQKSPAKPLPRPRPRIAVRPDSLVVQPKTVETDMSQSRGGSLNRYPMQQTTSNNKTPTSAGTEGGTYELVSGPTAVPSSTNDVYESIDDMKMSPQGFDVEMRKPQKPHGIFKGVLGENAKVRLSMYGMIGYDYSDESEDDILVSDPPLKPRGDSVDSITDSRPTSIIPTPNSRKTSGYLYKQGGQQNNRGWRKRWFVFDGKSLKYYRNEENTSESIHIIPVSQMIKIEYDQKDNGRARFHLVTKNRVFMLASDSITDANLWAQTLMEAIIQFKPESEEVQPGSDMSEPDKEGFLKKQGHNMMGDWKKRYVAIKGEYICYYDTYDDFRHQTPIHCIMAKLASVKSENHRSRFQIVTPTKAFFFQADNDFEASSWISAIGNATEFALSDKVVFDKVMANPANGKCADCGKKDPTWAAVNYCVCICIKCCGIHRKLGVHFSKSRSLLMDESVWSDQQIELMLKIGNKNANLLLEHKLPDDDRISPESNTEKRMEFIYAKYKDKRYSKISQDYGAPIALGKSLQENVLTDNVLKTLELIINKVEVKFVDQESEDQRTPVELAKDAGQVLQVELLSQNFGVDEPQPSPIKDYIAPIPSIEICTTEAAEKSGFLFMKRRLWFTLKDRSLKYYRSSSDKDPLGVIDLRTVMSLQLNENDGKTLDIITFESETSSQRTRTHTLKGETDEELESWHTALRNKQVFNVHLSFQDLGSDGIPHLVANCLQFIETYGLQQEGIYRVNGNQAKIKALIQLYNQDASHVILSLDDYSVHDVTGTLKKYLRNLPEKVFPDQFYDSFIRAFSYPDHNTKLMSMQEILTQLPKVNYDTLKRIIGHLTKVIADQPINRMGIENVSMIFCPNIMPCDDTDDKSMNLGYRIIKELIHYYQWFFNVNDDEIEKDKKMEDAMKKITQLREGGSGLSAKEFTLDIKVVGKEEKSCFVKVSDAMTAGELCMQIISQKGLQPENNWVLFEVVENLNIERALQYREKVLPVVMTWDDVFGEHGKNNYLIVKENHILESIQPFVGNTLALEGPLHVREPKRKDWKMSDVVLKNGKMVMDKGKSFFKSNKSDVDWSLHNLLVYVGVPVEKPQKGIDTSAGFTVVMKNDPELGTVLKYLCAKDRTTMFRWVATILNMKHPEGLWNDPDSTTHRVRDRQMFLGRQSNYLRRQGSSKHVVDEIKQRQKSLRRSTDRPIP